MHRHRLYLRSTPSTRGPKNPDNAWHGQLGPPPCPTRISHHRSRAHPEQAGLAEPPSDLRGQTMHRRDPFAASTTSRNDTGLGIPHARFLHCAQLIGLIFAAIALMLCPLSSRRRFPR